MSSRTSRPVLVALALGLTLAGCSDDGADVRSTSGSSSGSKSGSASGSSSGSSSTAADCPSPSPGGATVEVKLDEFSIQAPTTAKAGRLTFAVTNEGEEVHELVVVKGDATSFPRVTSTDPATNTAVDEDKLPVGAFVGEVEEIPAGQTCAGSFALAAGSYVLLCNIVEVHDGKPENHFDLGMQTTLTVT